MVKTFVTFQFIKGRAYKIDETEDVGYSTWSWLVKFKINFEWEKSNKKLVW